MGLVEIRRGSVVDFRGYAGTCRYEMCLSLMEVDGIDGEGKSNCQFL